MKTEIENLLKSKSLDDWKRVIKLIRDSKLECDDLIDLLQLFSDRIDEVYSDQYAGITRIESITENHSMALFLFNKFCEIIENKSAETIETTDRTGRE